VKALRRWWHQPDHFYWLTAFLAARGAQDATGRVLAAITFSLGVLPVAMLWSPAGPQGASSQLIAVAIAVIGLVTAGLWLQGNWPTRGWSGAYVVTAGMSIATSCLIMTDPVIGLLGTTAFAAIAGYIGFFHTARFMVCNLALATITTVLLTLRLAAEGDAVLAWCVFAFVAIVNLAVPFACEAAVHLLGIDVLNTEIDPLTGLLNRDTFYQATGEFVAARARIDDCYLIIVLVSLDNFTLLTGTDGRVSGDRARVAVAQTLRETTRTNAIVACIGEAEFLIADTFATTDATPLVERVRGAIATTPPRLTASGNKASTVVCATPTVLANKNTWDRQDTDDIW
jgi:diguanylate cyclase (GGDEF)-like protein